MQLHTSSSSLLSRLLTRRWLVPLAAITVLYLLTHAFSLVALPVFADESIYIRWAQLIIDDASRYLFFPLNDGKTPLFIWLLVPFQFLFSDQLLAARVVAVLVGLMQVYLLGWLARQLGGTRKTIILTMLLTVLLPFWYFHHRMALMDGLLTLWLSACLSAVIAIVTAPPKLQAGRTGVLALSFFFGLALLTKLPAILCVPVFGIWIFLPADRTWLQRFQLALKVGFGLGLGLAFFSLLKLHPAFGQLFSRGSDFLYPWKDVLFAGQWRQTLPNLPTYFSYFFQYLTPGVLLLVIGGLFLKPRQRTFHLLFWSIILFVLPISLLGRVVYPRYLLPAAIFATVSAALAAQTWLEKWRTTSMGAKFASSLVIAVLLGNTAASSGVFLAQSLTNPNQIPFVPADQTQYLLEWSSGHGMKETVELIQTTGQTTTLAVATEGYFGTLPDALLMYLHRRPVEGVFVEGIGQPVHSIPESFKVRARAYQRSWLVVNSHRLKITLPPEALVAEYCRPQGAPCLQVWDITSLVSE